ncbi:FAD/NAD(P)-binding domain-containing protein [Aspergillus udagawae]|uniref:FAD/NAD(P)-binding domain-containing protein n=1 Tax=Aspergillus udagawae TaxID=91492 RepID=A0ABQ1ACK2_9EURO|nr:FAD/NAD(P)-binding domain-containing protein [Aspergillus udagawae]GFG11763.1 FAD/NAD(P)-binding domain-containing protein [Aspergillus udagawae]
MEKAKFKVVIVGGSITGLTLAHCLHQANIDHIVLEKRHEIAPQEGASIGLWPNGGQILDQLGLYGELEKLTEPLNVMHVVYPDGFSYSNTLFRQIRERFGYPVFFMDRQKLLDVLYKTYPNKSKILVNKLVTELRQSDGAACVMTEDGSTYEGNLIVGADGVHSRLRSEIWRLADINQPGLVTTEEKQSMTVEYSCIFGISSPLPGLASGEHVNAYMNGLTVLTFHGKGGRVYWFIIQKLHRKFTYPNVPRFSLDDAERSCKALAKIRIWRDICIGHLWQAREVASMTALEENIFTTWHYQRAILLGDSIHKMTPNIGQGANSGIEDAALLASLINHLVNIQAIEQPSNLTVDRMLENFESIRYPRMEKIYRRSKFGVRMHTRDDLFKRVLGRYVIPFTKDRLAVMASQLIVDGAVLDFLPQPKRRSGPGWPKPGNCRDGQNGHKRIQYILMSIVLVAPAWVYILNSLVW